MNNAKVVQQGEAVLGHTIEILRLVKANRTKLSNEDIQKLEHQIEALLWHARSITQLGHGLDPL